MYIRVYIMRKREKKAPGFFPITHILSIPPECAIDDVRKREEKKRNVGSTRDLIYESNEKTCSVHPAYKYKSVFLYL
jgi:hypothetical protein